MFFFTYLQTVTSIRVESSENRLSGKPDIECSVGDKLVEVGR